MGMGKPTECPPCQHPEDIFCSQVHIRYVNTHVHNFGASEWLCAYQLSQQTQVQKQGNFLECPEDEAIQLAAKSWVFR